MAGSAAPVPCSLLLSPRSVSRRFTPPSDAEVRHTRHPTSTAQTREKAAKARRMKTAPAPLISSVNSAPPASQQLAHLPPLAQPARHPLSSSIRADAERQRLRVIISLDGPLRVRRGGDAKALCCSSVTFLNLSAALCTTPFGDIRAHRLLQPCHRILSGAVLSLCCSLCSCTAVRRKGDRMTVKRGSRLLVDCVSNGETHSMQVALHSDPVGQPCEGRSCSDAPTARGMKD